jgi:hypothetical protein
VSNSSQATAEEYYLTTEINDIKRYLRETGETQKAKIKKWAENLERLYEIGKSSVPVNQISTHIRNQAADELHYNHYQIEYITEVLPSKYKNNDDAEHGAIGGSVNQAKYNLAAIPLEQLKKLDNESLRTFIKKSKADADHALFEATNRGLAIVDHAERDAKISTELPQELETDFYYSLLDLADQSKEFTDNILAIAQKVKQFPIKDEASNKQKALETRAFAQFFYGLNQRMLPSLHDLKWAFSDWEWFNTGVKEENFSKHGAAVKSKIRGVDKDGNPTDDRPLTRERVGDVKEELYKDMQDVALTFDIGRCLMGLVAWHDIEGQVAARVADRRIRLSPKLSSTAFGADSGKEFHDE